MTDTPGPGAEDLARALDAPNSSRRLQVALAAGTRPTPAYVPVLVRRCGVEPDFFVRDMLTWALTRHAADLTVPALLAELRSPTAAARAQALHTLSKIGDVRAWPAISDAMLTDPDDEVATTAWRTAAGLVPPGDAPSLAHRLATQLGRGDLATWRSLSRALVRLGEAADPVLAAAVRDGPTGTRRHAATTRLLLRDPELPFDAALDEVTRRTDDGGRPC